MRLIADILSYPIIIITIGAMLLVPIEVLLEFRRDKQEYEAARQKIEADIRIWEIIAKNYDDIENACEKGYAIARLVIYHHRLDVLDDFYKKNGNVRSTGLKGM